MTWRKAIMALAAVLAVAVGVGAYRFLHRKAKRDQRARAELARLTADFRAWRGDRVTLAEKLAPHLSVGMSKAEVSRMLGKPTRNASGGAVWVYTVFWSRRIDLYFDSTGRLERIHPVGLGSQE